MICLDTVNKYMTVILLLRITGIDLSCKLLNGFLASNRPGLNFHKTLPLQEFTTKNSCSIILL